MKKLFLILLLLCASVTMYAQEAQNVADLEFLYQAIQKLPPYKDQLKGNQEYQRLYENLKKELSSTDDFEVYQKLLTLIYPLRDNHLGFYRKPDSTYKFKYLRPEVNVAELRQRYGTSPKDSVEGLYYNSDSSARYVVYSKGPNVFYAQNLTTKIVEAILTRTSENTFDVVRFSNPPVPYILQRNIRYRSGRFVGLHYQKDFRKTYENLTKPESNYDYQNINDSIGYLRLSSFNSTDTEIKKATDFFAKVKPSMDRKLLIVDVRNNGGGGYKNSGQFINLLKAFKGSIYILQNSSTVSNAEQFILKLKDLRHVTTLGATTRGTITYGSNYGNTLALPSGRYLFYPTDMSGSKKELAYEGMGIRPEIELDPFRKDWVEQTLDYINKN